MIGFVFASTLDSSAEKINKINEQNVFMENTFQDSHSHDHVATVDVYKFSKWIIPPSILGWILEALITGFVIKYIQRIRSPIILNGVG